MIIFITGLPCSGKSTLAKKAAEKLGMQYISTGSIAKELANTEELKKKMEVIDLFPLEEEFRIKLMSAISDFTKSYIVDGFPRFGSQADYIIDRLWDRMPLITVLNVGDYSTLYERARQRNRDCQDADLKLFTKRLSTASENLSQVESVIHQRLIPTIYIMCSGSTDPLEEFLQKLNLYMRGI